MRGREIGRKGIGFFFSREHEYVYEIHAPDYIMLDTDGDDGDVDISGWRADIDCTLDDGDLVLEDVRSDATKISARDGDIEIDGFAGRLDIRLDDGDVDLDLVSATDLDLYVSADDGDVSVTLGPELSASFTVETDVGSVDLASKDWILTKKDHRVTGEIGDSQGLIRIRTEDGGVTLR